MFTPAGGHIAVKAGWTSRGGQYISIADDGPGIPEEEIPIALSSFGRGSLAVSMAANGAGLGLPIAKGLADLLGGRLVLRSKPRAGTEAVVVFPASRAEAARPAPRSAAAAA
jgi:two-component system cell cycle sensor histidine kinase PleC